MGIDYRDYLIWQDGGTDQLEALSWGYNLEISSFSPDGFTAFTFADSWDSVQSESYVTTINRSCNKTRDEGNSCSILWKRRN